MIFRDFVNGEKFTIYEVFDNGRIRKFDTAFLKVVNDNYAILSTSLRHRSSAPFRVAVCLNECIARPDFYCTTIFVNKNDAKQYSINLCLKKMEEITSYVNDINNDLIEKVD